MEMRETMRQKKLYLLDMDGTLYLDNDLFPHCLDFLDAVRKRGGEYLYITNNSSKSVEKYVEKLTRLGIPAKAEEFFTSTDAACVHLKSHYHGKKIYALGTASFRAQLAGAGFPITDTLEDDIDEIKLRINALEAEIECAVTIDEATAYAVSHGMQYPLRAQYRQIVPGQAATGISPVNPIGGTVTPIDGPSGSFPGDDAPVQPLPEEPAPQEDGAIDLQIVEDPA